MTTYGEGSVVYIAMFEYGGPTLLNFVIERETDKTLKVVPGSVKYFLGRTFLPKRISKDSYHLFTSHKAAMDWLIVKSGLHVTSARNALEDARKNLDFLEKLRSTMQRAEEPSTTKVLFKIRLLHKTLCNEVGDVLDILIEGYDAIYYFDGCSRWTFFLTSSEGVLWEKV